MCRGPPTCRQPLARATHAACTASQPTTCWTTCYPRRLLQVTTHAASDCAANPEPATAPAAGESGSPHRVGGGSPHAHAAAPARHHVGSSGTRARRLSHFTPKVRQWRGQLARGGCVRGAVGARRQQRPAPAVSRSRPQPFAPRQKRRAAAAPWLRSVPQKAGAAECPHVPPVQEAAAAAGEAAAEAAVTFEAPAAAAPAAADAGGGMHLGKGGLWPARAPPAHSTPATDAAPMPAIVGAAGALLPLAVACMSRAGREPGYEKVNQDSCFAFEQFTTPDAALFGVMDGHGSEGAPATPLGLGRGGAGRGGAGARAEDTGSTCSRRPRNRLLPHRTPRTPANLLRNNCCRGCNPPPAPNHPPWHRPPRVCAHQAEPAPAARGAPVQCAARRRRRRAAGGVSGGRRAPRGVADRL